MKAKLIACKRLQHCARKPWLSWGFPGVGDDVVRIWRYILRGLLLSMGKKTEQTKSVLVSLKEVLSFSFILINMEL